MRPNLAALSLAACLMAGISTASAGLLPERIAKAAQDRVVAGTYGTLVFSVVDGDKSEVVAFGKLDNGRAPDGDTVYEIGSITKTFTATLLADAVLSRRATLDEPVARLLPDFKIPARGGKEIALVDLGTQRSGLPRLPNNLTPADPANPYADYDAAKLKMFLAGYELPRDPGASYEYSNLGFGLLGFALAEQAHTTYGTLVDEKIFRPLGMTMSGTTFSDTMRAHLAPGHEETGKPAKNWDLDALAGAGAIRSTANDMLRYLKANMGLTQSPLTTAMKFAQQPRRDVDAASRIGLAWMTANSGVIWHNGGTGGYRSFLGFTTDGHLGVVVLTNTDVQVDDLGFGTLLASAPLAQAHKAITLPDASLDDYVGTYKLKEGFLLKIFREGGQFYAQATGQGAFPIYPFAPNEFFANVASIAISFSRDAHGAVTALTLHQNGDRVAPKMTAAELPKESKAIQLDAATLKSYEGKYQLAPGIVFDVTVKDNQLFAQLTGQWAFAVYGSARDKFFYKVIDAQLTFERDANGNVTALVLHQNGTDRRAPRIAP